jgi:hypothetical protein
MANDSASLSELAAGTTLGGARVIRYALFGYEARFAAKM